MKVEIKVTGLVYSLGEVVELSEYKALSLINQGKAVEYDKKVIDKLETKEIKGQSPKSK